MFVLALVGAFVVSVAMEVPAAPAQQSSTATVTRIVDGDTVQVTVDRDVRLIGVDTLDTVEREDPVEPYGPQASAFTKKQLEGKRVTLQFDAERTDQFGRTLAYVKLGNSLFNTVLVTRGYAQVYIEPPSDKYETQLLRASTAL